MPQRHIYDLFKEALYGDQPAGWSIGGYEKSIANITKKDIVEYFQKQYRGDNIIAVFAGNISHARALALAKKHLSDLPSGNSYDKAMVAGINSSEQKVYIQKKSSDQTHIALGFRGVNMQDERRYAVNVLAMILGGGMSSRLFTEIRERRGLAYYVRAGEDSGTDYGYFVNTAGVANRKVEQAIGVLVKELRKMKKEPVARQELKKAKNHIEGATLLGLETSDAVAFEIGTQEILLNKIIMPLEYVEKIKKVTISQVREVARDIFSKETMRLALIGPYKNKEKLENIISKI